MKNLNKNAKKVYVTKVALKEEVDEQTNRLMGRIQDLEGINRNLEKEVELQSKEIEGLMTSNTQANTEVSRLESKLMEAEKCLNFSKRFKEKSLVLETDALKLRISVKGLEEKLNEKTDQLRISKDVTKKLQTEIAELYKTK